MSGTLSADAEVGEADANSQSLTAIFICAYVSLGNLGKQEVMNKFIGPDKPGRWLQNMVRYPFQGTGVG